MLDCWARTVHLLLPYQKCEQLSNISSFLTGRRSGSVTHCLPLGPLPRGWRMSQFSSKRPVCNALWGLWLLYRAAAWLPTAMDTYSWDKWPSRRLPPKLPLSQLILLCFSEFCRVQERVQQSLRKGLPAFFQCNIFRYCVQVSCLPKIPTETLSTRGFQPWQNLGITNFWKAPQKENTKHWLPLSEGNRISGDWGWERDILLFLFFDSVPFGNII